PDQDVHGYVHPYREGQGRGYPRGPHAGQDRHQRVHRQEHRTVTEAIFVLGVGGSTRPNSTTECALRVSLAAADAAGAETLMLGSADLLLPLYEPDGLDRGPKAVRLLEEVRRADGLIIASPGYHGALSGMVK